ncbi:MAG TPA: radical SAM family heme chaperone HemW [Ignavibacteriaceae bacterium]|nr:radical SAM family heme chaperone HemW [Ignavibacteriaceae bacterium]
MKKTAIYIHIPFCDNKCIYCDFYSIITTDNIIPFLRSIEKEIDHYAEIYSTDRKYISIYFGGGTPSLMAPSYISDIINYLHKKFQIDPDAEITLETNPGTVDKYKLKEFLAAGINRISIGIQSFHNDELRFLTRIHDSQTAVNTVLNAKDAGFENVSLDLIFNLPGQTKQKWAENLTKAVSLPITHLSAYSLILERGTILNKMVHDKKIILQDDDYDADLYEYAIDFLEDKNFNQYEVSNFCLPGYECRHNNAYWNYIDYLSFGTSAHSFMDGKRWWNFSSLKRYIDEIRVNHEAIAGFEYVTAEQQMNEYIMLALRSSGLNLSAFKEKFNDSWIKNNYDYLLHLKQANFITLNNDFIRLTRKGYALCDEILAKLH